MGRTTTPAAARKAAAGKPTNSVTVGDVTVTLPAEMPAAFVWIIADADSPDQIGPRQMVQIIEMLVTDPDELDAVKRMPFSALEELVSAMTDALSTTGKPDASPET